MNMYDSSTKGNFRQGNTYSPHSFTPGITGDKTVLADNGMSPLGSSAYLFTNPNHVIATLTNNKVPLQPLPNSTSVRGHIFGRQLPILIDTGASVTAIKASIFHQLPDEFRSDLSPSPIDCLRAVSGAVIPVLGYTHISFDIAGEQYPFQTLFIESLTYGVILGRDFLEFYHAKN